MSAHIAMWTTIASFLSGLLPAKFAVLLPAICRVGAPNPPDENECKKLLWFVKHFLRQGKFDQINALEEHTGFSFPKAVHREYYREYIMAPHESINPPDLLGIVKRNPATRKILIALNEFDVRVGGIDNMKPTTVTWLCEQIKKESPSEKRDTFIIFVTAFAVCTERSDIVDHVIKTIKTHPPASQNLYIKFKKVPFIRCSVSLSTPIIHRLAEGFGLSDIDLFQKCRPSDILRRYFLCESEESAKWLLRRACNLSEEGDPWLLTSWNTPKSLHKKRFLEAVFNNVKYITSFGCLGSTIKRRTEHMITLFRKTLPPGFKAPTSEYTDFVRYCWASGFGELEFITTAEQLLDVLGFDLKRFVKEKFQDACVPKDSREMSARNLTSLCYLCNPVPTHTMPWTLLTRHYHSNVGAVLGWLKTFLAPSDLIYPDGFSRFLPELVTTGDLSTTVAIYNFLKAMGYTTANERKHGHPAKTIPIMSPFIGVGDIDSRIPEE